MGNRQQDFLERFRTAFAARFSYDVTWSGGQIRTNTAALAPDLGVRRNGYARPGERFEMGDLRCHLAGSAVVVEYESDAMAVHNLVKYWPYLRGELTSTPSCGLVICHFSNWASYGSYRDLWQWLVTRMSDDSGLLVPFQARQFDHGGTDHELASRSLSDAIEWIAQVTDGLRTA